MFITCRDFGVIFYFDALCRSKAAILQMYAQRGKAAGHEVRLRLLMCNANSGFSRQVLSGITIKNYSNVEDVARTKPLVSKED